MSLPVIDVTLSLLDFFRERTLATLAAIEKLKAIEMLNTAAETVVDGVKNENATHPTFFMFDFWRRPRTKPKP